MQVGDVVLLKNNEEPRMKWPLGLVVAATPDVDGLVRKVCVRVGSKELDQNGCRKKGLPVFERPVQKVVLLLGVSDADVVA